MVEIEIHSIQKGDLVRLSIPRGKSKGFVRYRDSVGWVTNEYPYAKDTWFEVLAPFKGSEYLTVTFANVPDQTALTRKRLETWKHDVVEVKRPEKVPVYKKQLSLF